MGAAVFQRRREGQVTATGNGAVALYVTCPDLAGAEAIALALVEARLAASVNILPGARSIYWWRGKIERADEVVMVAKTMGHCVEPAMALIVAMHPYDTPAIVAFDIVAGSPRYLEWLAAEATGG
jgi:periplasmic divalent cation tolerance protein